MYRFGTGGADKNIFTGVPTLLPVSTNQMAAVMQVTMHLTQKHALTRRLAGTVVPVLSWRMSR